MVKFISYICFTKLAYTVITKDLGPDTGLYGQAMI